MKILQSISWSIAWAFMLVALLFVFVAFMVTADRWNQTFGEWCDKYKVIIPI